MGVSESFTRSFEELLRRTVRGLLRAKDRATLFQEACRIAVEVGGLRLAWVGWREGERVVPLARAGHDNGYVDAVAAQLSGERGRGPTGRAMTTGEPQYCDDFLTDERVAPWREGAARNGLRSCIVLPFQLEGRVVGTLALYSQAPSYFAPNRRDLLVDLAEDITFTLERLAQRERLTEVEHRYQTLFEHAGDAIFIADSTGRYLDANAAAQRLLGYDKDELRRLTMHELIVPEDLTETPLVLERLKPEVATRGERRLRRKDGTAVAVEINGTRLAGGLLLGIARDVSERNRLVTELLSADRLATVGRFAAGIAHELSNPLVFVQMNLEWLRSQLEPGLAEPAALKATVDEALEGAERVSRLIQELKSFARPSEDALEPVDLAQAVGAALHIVGHHVRSVAALTTESEPVAQVQANASRLEQVVMNLLVNAAQAVADCSEKRIGVHVFQAGGMGVVEVRDSGGGIAPEVAPRVFEPFFTTKGTGTGLGLAICQSLVQRWGGNLTFRPNHPRGTIFRLEVPLAPSGAAPAAP